MASTNSQIFDCLCRSCMQEVFEISQLSANSKTEQQWQSIFNTIEDCGDMRIAELLSTSVPQIAEVQLSDELPKKICSSCLQQLLNVYRFQQMCTESDQKMRDLIIATIETKAKRTKTRQESLLGVKEETIELDPVSTLAQSTEASVMIKNEPCIVNETIAEYGGESLHSIVTVKNEEMTSERVEEHVEASAIKIGEQTNVPEQSQNKGDEPYRFKCDICERHFQKPESLHSHRLAHADKQIIGKTCNICDKVYSTRFTLARHKRIYHSTEKSKKRLKQYTCEFCNKNFKNSVALKVHVRKHTGERPYLCPECGKSFGQASGLKEHILRHGDAKSFECPYCPLMFRCRSDVSKHKITHEGIKRHICDVCGDSFGKSNQLVVHKRIHNNEKPYKCEYCEMRFGRRDSQHVHMRTHTGEKPYKCNYCERAFAQKGDHTKHLRTHLGDNVYRCKLCPLAFPLSSEMRSHFMKHKDEDPETRERNMKALKEEEAKLQLKMAEKDTQ